MLKVVTTKEEFAQYATKGNLKVFTSQGKWDIILGKYLEHFVRTGYVLAVVD